MFTLYRTHVFTDWWQGLSPSEQDSVSAVILQLRKYGPLLPFPYSSGIKGSQLPHLRELRIQHRRKPYRILYAFDPHRNAILLVGGRKSGKRWYSRNIRIAERLYQDHIKQLRRR